MAAATEWPAWPDCRQGSLLGSLSSCIGRGFVDFRQFRRRPIATRPISQKSVRRSIRTDWPGGATKGQEYRHPRMTPMRPFVKTLLDCGSVALGALAAVIAVSAIVSGLMPGSLHPVMLGLIFLLVVLIGAATEAAALWSRPWLAQPE